MIKSPGTPEVKIEKCWYSVMVRTDPAKALLTSVVNTSRHYPQNTLTFTLPLRAVSGFGKRSSLGSRTLTVDEKIGTQISTKLLAATVGHPL